MFDLFDDMPDVEELQPEDIITDMRFLFDNSTTLRNMFEERQDIEGVQLEIFYAIITPDGYRRLIRRSPLPNTLLELYRKRCLPWWRRLGQNDAKLKKAFEKELSFAFGPFYTGVMKERQEFNDRNRVQAAKRLTVEVGSGGIPFGYGV